MRTRPVSVWLRPGDFQKAGPGQRSLAQAGRQQWLHWGILCGQGAGRLSAAQAQVPSRKPESSMSFKKKSRPVDDPRHNDIAHRNI